MHPKLIDLYQQLYNHTRGVCSGECRVPRSCCSPEYGDMNAEFMKEQGEPVPESTGHPKCRFLGPEGCIIAPHWRPLCTRHVCCINSLGFRPGHPEWTAKYFDLVERIDSTELTP